MMSTVAVAKCHTYERAEVALERCLAELGGMGAFVRPGDRTLLKVNLVSGHDESRAVTTHPAIVSAVIRQVRNAGGIPFVGDSPALASAVAVARRAGIAKVCAEQHVSIVDLDEPVFVSAARAKRAFRLSKQLRQFDVIVNIPKLKTHCLVGMTGAVKNMFGCIPGRLKTGHHLAQPGPIEFSEMLLALHDTVTPKLTVVDGVVGMEGPGPGAGDPRLFGVVVAGPSSIAVDTVCARILGFADKEVSTVWLAQQRNISEAALGNIEVRGEQIGEVAIANLKKPRSSVTTRLPGPLMNLGKRLLTPGPAVLQDRCLLCGDCMRICPARAVSMSGHGPRFDSRSCIRCYCCHEICPASAIILKGWFEDERQDPSRTARQGAL